MIDESKIIVYKLYFVEKKKFVVCSAYIFCVNVNFEKFKGGKLGLFFVDKTLTFNIPTLYPENVQNK